MKRTILVFSLALFSCALATGAIAAGKDLTMMEQLGKIMYQDKDFSRNRTQSCQTCHHHVAGYADPTNMRDPENTVVSLGDDGVSLGGRNAPSSAYCGFSPPLALRSDGSYAGGLFWDGRAKGDDPELLDPLAEQAQGPPLNPVEMNMESAEAVVEVVRDSSYRHLFLNVFGPGSLDDVDSAFDDIARAIAAYERSTDVQRFSSRFDGGQLTPRELRGKELFAANCSSCHPSAGPKALFTDYSFANLGIPVNPLLAGNPTDLGLGGVLANNNENGKFKVPTLRNIALTAPYSHNGYFASLREMVRFIATRDTTDWPEPEVSDNLSSEIGSMLLTDRQIDDIVSFLETLTDE